MKSNKVLAIALDAAEPALIEKWMDEGYLKNLAALKTKGAYGRLNSSADWLVGSTWPTFYTSALPNTHGFYHYLQWDSSVMDYDRPNPNWISATPFWRQLGSQAKVIAVDIPLAPPPTPFNGVEISGWAAHDRIYPVASYPPKEIKAIIKKIGKPLINDEIGGLQDIAELLKLKQELIEANEKETDLIMSLLKTEEWNLFLCCFASTHRGGHKFWDHTYDQKQSYFIDHLTNVKGDYSIKQAADFKKSLKEIYKSCDESIGRIIKSLSEDVTIIVFSLHGMGVNTSLADKMLPQMLSKILRQEKDDAKQNAGYISKIRNLIPLKLRSKMRSLLPTRLQDKMTSYWRMGKMNWAETKAFSMVADLQGYIRINLKAREREGIIEQKDYDELCDQIIEGIKTFVDVNTRESIVESIIKTRDLFPQAEGFNKLPDIIVKWKFKPAVSYSKIISPLYGEVDWPSPGLNSDGRSGNHRSQGFLLASGRTVRNVTFPRKHIIDIAPTILDILGIPVPDSFKGETIKEIIC